MNELIVVEQLPVITQQLAMIKEKVVARVNDATSLVCNEETLKIVKVARADLNKEFKQFEDKRKEVKSAVMKPYEDFETVYKDCISDTYKSADSELKAKISSVENGIKAEKEQEVKEYFDEYLASKEIDFVNYENAGINVTLSASKKSLKEQAKAYIDRICDDLNLIETQEHKAEILVEYKRTLNVSQAITTVSARIKAIEDEKKRQEEAERRKAEFENQREETKVTLTPPTTEPITAPTVEVEEPELTLRFKVTATKSKLRELKAFLDNGGYKYE